MRKSCGRQCLRGPQKWGGAGVGGSWMWMVARRVSLRPCSLNVGGGVAVGRDYPGCCWGRGACDRSRP